MTMLRFIRAKRGYHRPSWELEDSWRARWQGAGPGRPVWHYVAFAGAGSLTAYMAAMIADAEVEKRRRSRMTGWISGSKRSSPYIQSSNVLTVWWNGLRESQKTMAKLIAINSAVFLAWRVPSLDRFMSRYFLHSTTSHPITMLTSIFSHKTPMHFGFNIIALWSFGSLLHDRMGREHFLAFCITSGLTASLGSHLYKAWRRDSARSLGASGALFGIAGACAHFPDVNISLIFLPFHSFSLEKALPLIMAFDAFGLWRGWRSFDHAAHLTGAATGYLLYNVSNRRIWRNRRNILHAIGYPIK